MEEESLNLGLFVFVYFQLKSAASLILTDLSETSAVQLRFISDLDL